MTRANTKPRVDSLAPQFLVDDLARSIASYEKLGFTFRALGWVYAIGYLDGLELHLKEAGQKIRVHMLYERVASAARTSY